MSDDIKAAAERWGTLKQVALGNFVCRDGERYRADQLMADMMTLAKAYVDELAAREAVEAERAKPISMEFVCRVSPTGDRWFGNGFEAIYWQNPQPKVAIWVTNEDDDPGCGTFIRDCFTCGEFIDVLRGLGVGVAG